MHQRDVLDVLRKGVINDEIQKTLEEIAGQLSASYK